MLSNIDDPTDTSLVSLHLLWSLAVNKHPLTKVQLAMTSSKFLGGFSKTFNFLAFSGLIPQLYMFGGKIWITISWDTISKLYLLKETGTVSSIQYWHVFYGITETP